MYDFATNTVDISPLSSERWTIPGQSAQVKKLRPNGNVRSARFSKNDIECQETPEWENTLSPWALRPTHILESLTTFIDADARAPMNALRRDVL